MSSPDEAAPQQASPPESILSAISNEMVRIYKSQFGRGPTRVRTEWAGPDAIVVFLEDTFTLAERNLIKMDEHQRLRELRLLFQYASVHEFCEPVEWATGRRVRAFISGIDTEADGLAIETFVLHPRGSDAPSRIEQSERHVDGDGSAAG